MNEVNNPANAVQRNAINNPANAERMKGGFI